MATDIQTYLKELQAAMAAGGADPAVVQDALFDAEEHLQAEMAVGGVVGRGTAIYEERFAAAVEGYGTPEEVAAAYLGTAPAHDVVAAYQTALANDAATATERQASGGAPSVTEATSGAQTEPAVQTGPEMQAEPAVQTGPEMQAEPPAEETPVIEAQPAATAGGETSVFAPRFCPKCGQELRPGAAFCSACGNTVRVAAAPAGALTAPPVGVQAGMAASSPQAGAPPSVWRDIFGVFADPAVYKALIYMILSLATGIAYFTIVVTGVSTCAPLLIMIIGIPLFLLFLGLVRAMSLFEGRLVEWLLGARMPRRLRSAPPNSGILERIGFWVKDGRTWASLAYMILMLPLGIIYFTIAVTGLSAGIGLLATPLWAWTTWAGSHTFIFEGRMYEWSMPAWSVPLSMIAGALVLIGMMHLIKWIGRGHASFAKAMLVRLDK